MNYIKVFLKQIIPLQLRAYIRKTITNFLPLEYSYRGLSNKEIFKKIYMQRKWGKNEKLNRLFYSGIGSHDEKIVNGYVKEIKSFLSQFRSKKIVLDLGCGDFTVGSKIARQCLKYIACDIVEEVIQENKSFYKYKNVEFKSLDITKDKLPSADVITIRQVLQHLSNQDIINFLNKIKKDYKYLIVTEHIPLNEGFIPNIDKPSGADTRLFYKSGLNLSLEPFNLEYKESKVICEFEGYDGRIQTILYVLN